MQRRRHPAMMKAMLTSGALLVVCVVVARAQTVVMPQVPTTSPTTKPTTAPTTREAAYSRLLGSDVSEADRPILPTGRSTIDQTTGDAAVAPNAPQIQTRREGTYIVNQTGHLAKSADGQGWDFVFVADAQALQDPPMKVLPNLKLAGMEDNLETMNRDLLFRVTGMVTEYRGRNYILLDKVVVVQDLK